MTAIEECLLQNQVEIMWALSYLLGKAAPELAGRGGELDRMRDDLAASAKNSNRLLDTCRKRDADPKKHQGER